MLSGVIHHQIVSIDTFDGNGKSRALPNAKRRPAGDRFSFRPLLIAIKRYKRLFADGFDFRDRLNPNMERLGQWDDGLGR